MTYQPSPFIAEAAARHRARVAQAEASRRARFPDLFTGDYSLDRWRKYFGATVAWCAQGSEEFGDKTRSDDAQRGLPVEYVLQCLADNRRSMEGPRVGPGAVGGKVRGGKPGRSSGSKAAGGGSGLDADGGWFA